jgi:hypothetical protein
MRNWAAGITARRGRAIAVVALARELAGVLFVMWRDECDFAPKRHAAGDNEARRVVTGRGTPEQRVPRPCTYSVGPRTA